MQTPPTLDEILLTLSDNDYIEYLRINLCGTIDDTSHTITYKKNRKNAGTLTVLNKTTPVHTREYCEYETIHGYNLIIDDMDYFNSVVMDYLKGCAFCEPFNPDVACGIWFELYIRFSNKAIVKLFINTPYMVECTDKLYKTLETYDELLFGFKAIPDKVKELHKESKFVGKWNGYNVYAEFFKGGIPAIGLPRFILYKNGEARFTTEDEAFAFIKDNPEND